MLFNLLFYLIVGHMLFDFALQPDVMAGGKCRRSGHPVQNDGGRA